MNPTLKRYLVSSLTTFLSVFFLSIGSGLHAGGMDIFTTGAIVSLISLALRAGVKAAIEAIPSLGSADKLVTPTV